MYGPKSLKVPTSHYPQTYTDVPIYQGRVCDTVDDNRHGHFKTPLHGYAYAGGVINWAEHEYMNRGTPNYRSSGVPANFIQGV